MFIILVVFYLFCLSASILAKTEGTRVGCSLVVLTMHLLVAGLFYCFVFAESGILKGVFHGGAFLIISLLVAQGLRLAIREIARALTEPADTDDKN